MKDHGPRFKICHLTCAHNMALNYVAGKGNLHMLEKEWLLGIPALSLLGARCGEELQKSVWTVISLTIIPKA